jgi:hypothetical protein
MAKKKQSEEKKIIMNKRLSTFNVLVYFILSLAGCTIMVFVAHAWGIQFHNFDLSYNMALLINDMNNADSCNETLDFREMKDRWGLGENDTVSYEDVYVSSSDFLSELIFLAFYGAGMFAFGICGLVFMLSQFIESDAEKNLTLLKIYKQKK